MHPTVNPETDGYTPSQVTRLVAAHNETDNRYLEKSFTATWRAGANKLSAVRLRIRPPIIIPSGRKPKGPLQARTVIRFSRDPMGARE